MRFERLDKMLGIAMKAALWCIVVLVFAIALSGCGSMDPYVRVGVGAVTNDVAASGGPAFMGSVGSQGRRHYCEWTHFSMINRGSPFDNRAEPSLDWVGCGVMFGGPERERHSWLFEKDGGK